MLHWRIRGESVQATHYLVGVAEVRACARLDQQQSAQVFKSTAQQLAQVSPLLGSIVDGRNAILDRLADYVPHQFQRDFVAAKPQHLAHIIFAYWRAIRHYDLLQQVLGIAQPAVGDAGYEVKRLIRHLDAFLLAYVSQLRHHLVDGYSTEVISLAARDDGQRDLMRLGGRQNEHRMRRRLFERLQKRVERRLGQHVDFVDDVYLVARLIRRKANLVAQVTNVIYAPIARRINLDEVERSRLVNAHADMAFVVRLTVLRRQAVYSLRQNARRARLACAACPAEQVGMCDALTCHRLPQSLRNDFLPEYLAQALGPPFPVKDLSHANLSSTLFIKSC